MSLPLDFIFDYVEQHGNIDSTMRECRFKMPIGKWWYIKDSLRQMEKAHDLRTGQGRPQEGQKQLPAPRRNEAAEVQDQDRRSLPAPGESPEGEDQGDAAPESEEIFLIRQIE